MDKDGFPHGFGKLERKGGITTIGHHEDKGEYYYFLPAKGHVIRFNVWGEIHAGEWCKKGGGRLVGHVIKMIVTDAGVTPEYWVYNYGYPVKNWVKSSFQIMTS